MKTLITIMSVLFLSPMAAHSFGLYEKSGGYESSGGYERSGGYESSQGHERSGGYESSGGYDLSQEGYQVDTPVSSKRQNKEGFDDQMRKARTKKGKWIANRLEKDRIREKLRKQIRRTGGARDPMTW